MGEPLFGKFLVCSYVMSLQSILCQGSFFFHVFSSSGLVTSEGAGLFGISLHGDLIFVFGRDHVSVDFIAAITLFKPCLCFASIVVS